MHNFFDTNTQNLATEGNFETGSAIKAADLNLLIQEIQDVYECFGGHTFLSTTLQTMPALTLANYTISPLWGVAPFGKGGKFWINTIPNKPNRDAFNATISFTQRTAGAPTTVVNTEQITIKKPFQTYGCFFSSQNTVNTHIIGDFKTIPNDVVFSCYFLGE